MTRKFLGIWVLRLSYLVKNQFIEIELEHVGYVWRISLRHLNWDFQSFPGWAQWLWISHKYFSQQNHSFWRSHSIHKHLNLSLEILDAFDLCWILPLTVWLAELIRHYKVTMKLFDDVTVLCLRIVTPQGMWNPQSRMKSWYASRKHVSYLIPYTSMMLEVVP